MNEIEKAIRSGTRAESVDASPFVSEDPKGDILAGVIIRLDNTWVVISSDTAYEMGEELIHQSKFAKQIEAGKLPPTAAADYRKKRDAN